MAKKLAHKYSFDASARQVRIDGNISHDRILLISNITDNVTIYNFADPTLKATAIEYDSATEETVVTLQYDTNQMSDTDTLQIFYEKDYVSMEPSETYVDPVSKFRVSTPENLIDTDFEYGPQASKWETLQLINQIPSFFSSTADTTIPFITKVESTQDSEIITVTTGFEHGLTSGIPITVTGLTSLTAEGTYLIQSVPTNTTFTYKARAKQLLSTELQGTYTSIIPGEFFQGSQIALESATGITSDFFDVSVTVVPVVELTLDASVVSTWIVGNTVTSDSGAEGILSKASGTSIFLRNVTGTFANSDVISIVGSTATFTITNVASSKNVFFFDDVQQPDYDLRKKAIYKFDLSHSSLSTHAFEFSTTQDGIFGPDGYPAGDPNDTGDAGVEYTTFVYKFGTPGTAGAYLRIYTTNTTPDLYYYCPNHPRMGGVADSVYANDTKVILRTVSDHGFADDTNFYFVNSISPKALDIIDQAATAPDDRPYTDVEDNVDLSVNPENDGTIPFDNESTYTLRFDSTAVNYSQDSINIPNHNLQSGYALLYYPSPGDLPIGGLQRMCVYYAERIDDNNIKLHDSQRTNLLKNLSVGGTWNYGSHQLGLCYNVTREYKTWGDEYLYYYTYYWEANGTYSGHDFSSNTAPYNTTYGLGGEAWDMVATFSIARPGYGGHNFFVNNYEWYQRFGTNWKTYGYNLTTLPLGTTDVYQGGYDFITDNNNYGVNGDNDGGYTYGYTYGGYGNTGQARRYWRSNFWGYDMQGNGDYLRVYGDDWTYWRYQGDTNYYWARRRGYRDTNDRRFNTVSSDGNTNMYFMLCKRNTSTNDTFYAPDHRYNTDDLVTLTVNSGNDIRYWSNKTNGVSTYGTGQQFYIERVDENRFRIKTSPSASAVRIAAADGDYNFDGTVVNIFKNSFYISDNQFSNNELILVTADVGATLPTGIADNNSYYFKAINNNRFQLLANVGDTNEIDLTGTPSGLVTFENASASFGAVDGSYTTTRAVDEVTLEITLPFKISPGKKPFDAASDVDVTNDLISIANHYFAPGTKVIYDSDVNADIGGLTNNTDYYVIVKDSSKIQLAASLADATASTPVPITLTAASTGTHRLITANLSGLIAGAGTIAVNNGSRSITGTETQFKRYFKVGDTITLIDTTTSPTGTLYTSRITAIKDDLSMLVEDELTFSDATAQYLIPTYIYVRPDGYFLHRPFDGGMEIGTSKSPDGLICRQTRKYFRYQSGKGIQTSFAINFIPQNPIVLLAYTPQGTTGTYTLSGSTGDENLTVAEGTTSLAKGMEFPDGTTGLDDGTFITEIVDSTTIKVSNVLTAPLSSESVSLTAAQYATIKSQRPHNVEEGTVITISQSDISDYNGDFSVVHIINDFEFMISVAELGTNLSASGGFPQFGVKNWTNSFVRAGMFDFQNGFFFEYDGSTLNCCRRSSVQQLTGTLGVTRNSSVVEGTETLFTTQLEVGDNIVIRGMTHRVITIRNNTELVIQPAYRGSTNTNVIGTKTVDVKTGQSNWNIDKCDGNGVSGFILDINRIQMCYMDYSWYGAGKIRYGFKDQNGHVKYVHEYKHNNRLRESYFRSGNLPARYEIENKGAPSFVPSLFHWGTSVIMDGMFQDDEAYLFTASGNVLKFTNSATDTAGTSGNAYVEEVYYTRWSRTYYIRIPFDNTANGSKVQPNTLIFNNSVANSYFVNGRAIANRVNTSGTDKIISVQYIDTNGNTIFPRRYASTIASALGGTTNNVIASGTVFNIGAPAGEENLIPDYMPLISIRLAPSVDSSITGALGEREIINRMQLALESVGVQCTHDSEITLILNAELSTDLFEDVSSPSLCQLVKHLPNETISGGQRILSFRATGGADFTTQDTTYDLSEISSLGNSILGGDGVYPNGPDLLTVIAEVKDSSGVDTTFPYTTSARITWKESQA